MDTDEDSGLNQVSSVNRGTGVVSWVLVHDVAVYIVIHTANL